MLLITAMVVVGCLWLLPRFLGGLDALSGETSAIIHVITGGQALDAEEAPPVQTEVADMAAVPVSTPAPAPLAPTAEPTPRTMTVRAVGSIHGTKNIRQSALDPDTGSFQFREIFAPVQPLLSSADLTLATLETTLAGEEAGYGDYNTPSQLLDAMQYAGIDLLSLATERSLEYGAEGLRETLRAAESKGFLTVGVTQTPEENPPPKIFLVNDIQVAVLSYTYGLSKNSLGRTNQVDYPMVSQINADLIRMQITEARKQGANLVIVMMHWGTKNQVKLNDQQKSMSTVLCEAGADVVIGAHPNVPQALEVRQSESGNRTLIAYSLGSLLSDDRDINNASSMMLGFSVEMDVVSKRISISEITYTPIWVERTKPGSGGYQYRILRAGDEATRESRAASEQRGMENAYRVVTKAAGEGEWQIQP